MSARGARLLERRSEAPQLPYATPVGSEQSLETTAVMAIDESLVRFQASPRARTALFFKPVKHGVQVPFAPRDYNYFFDGVDRHDALRVHLQAEDELR